MATSFAYRLGKFSARHPFIAIAATFFAIFAISATSCSGEDDTKKITPIVPAQYSPPAYQSTPEAQGSPSVAREVCKQFIERSGYKVHDWGESWNWTTIHNNDESFSVGARFIGMPPGGGVTNLYVTCVAKKKSGDQWALEKLTRLR